MVAMIFVEDQLKSCSFFKKNKKKVLLGHMQRKLKKTEIVKFNCF